MQIKGRAVVGIYIDVDFYPPTINAILNLAEKYEEVFVVTRNNSAAVFPFPSNVRICKVGRLLSVRETEKISNFRKVFSFFKFTFCLIRVSISSKTKLIVLYDAIPLLSYFMISWFLKGSVKIWYHNHDMPSIERLRKYSIGWFSAKYERNAMGKINFFSLPSEDRLQFYPNLPDSIKYFTLPNYPSVKVYRKSVAKQDKPLLIRLIYQGFIGEGHSIEEIVELLNDDFNGHQLHLVLKGSVRPEFKEVIEILAKKLNVGDHITWIGIGPYSDLPSLTSSCDIGIAIHKNTDNVSKTLGTASNKIYEYAASGLPVLLYNIEQFEKYLKKYSWTFFTDGSVDSLRYNIASIIEKLPELSVAARHDFESELSYEQQFNRVYNVISP